MLEQLEADVVVVGAGAAGLAAAVGAQRRIPEARVVVVCSGQPGFSGCSPMVQGLNAAIAEPDSPGAHFQDMVQRGCYLNDQRLAWKVAHEVPSVVADLETGPYGGFARRPDGSYDQRPFGAQTHPRKLHLGYDTGRLILDSLLRTVQAQEVVMLWPYRGAEVLFDADGVVAGLMVVDIESGRAVTISAASVVIATGGAPNVFERTSAASGKVGDGLALCVRAGAECRDMEMMQFLSVGLLDPTLEVGEPLPLLEESFRLAGARLRNVRGDRFLASVAPDVMEAADLETVVRSCWKEIAEGRAYPTGGVGLDLRHLPLDELELAAAIPFQRIRQAGLDPRVDIIGVSPVAHYQIGGVVIDEDGATDVPGLFAAGEDAGGVHGAAWTGGNGMAEALVLGTRAGEAAAEAAGARVHGPAKPAAAVSGSVTVSDPTAALRDLRKLMWRFAGPVRTGEGLREAKRRIWEISGGVMPLEAWSDGLSSPESLNLRNLLVSSLFLVESALARSDSLGVHWRADSIPSDPVDALRHSAVRIVRGELVVQMRPVHFEFLRPSGLDRQN